jgi:uncharacterized protein
MAESDGRKTALITGASSGLGAEFARQLAALGYNLVLTARRTDRLAALAETLHARTGVRAESLTADLSTDAGVAAVEGRLAEGDVHLLVNNAGFGIGGAFAEADIAGQAAMVQVHMVAPMRLMHAALPHMVARRSGGIINVASLAAFFVLPGDANYGATKAYLMRFSLAVHGEVRRQGVTVQALCPGFTVTEFHDDQERVGMSRNALPGFLWGSSQAVVRDSLVALSRRRSLCVPGRLNRLLMWVGRSGLADWVTPLVVRG